MVQLHLRFFINYYLEYLSSHILESLYKYRTIPEEWTCFFKERESPDIPENISDQKRITETTDTDFLDQEQLKKRAKTKKERHTYQLPKISNLHWQKSRPNTFCNSTRNVFSKLHYTSNKVLDISISFGKAKRL